MTGCNMELHYQNIWIRNAEENDARILADWWNDGTVMAHAGFPNGLGTTAEKIAVSLSTDSDDTRRRLMLLWKEQPIGEMSYKNLENGSADIGIKICETNYQEKGIGRIALSLLIRELFRRGYSQIVLDTNLKNLRAQHVYEALGFQKIRVNIDSWRNQMGELESSVDYELTEDAFVNFAV